MCAQVWPSGTELPTQIVTQIVAEIVADMPQLLLPVAWVHIPKTGTSFLNTLVASVCIAPTVPFAAGELQHNYWEHVSRSRCNFTSSPQHNTYGSPPGHHGFGRYADAELVSNGVTLLRQPDQRIISGFHHNFHSYDIKLHGKPEITTYARAVAGCSVRMLVRPSVPSSSDSGEAACGHSPSPSDAEVDQAKAILSSFQFVGLTDEWDLTICLWHARFGPASCHISEFLNARPRDGNVTSVPNYDVSVLNGFTDRYDNSLYEHAQKLFWNAIKLHKLTRTQCAAWKATCISSSKR